MFTVHKPYSTSYKYSRILKTSINTGLFNSQNISEHITLLNHLDNPEINMIITSILRSMGKTNKNPQILTDYPRVRGQTNYRTKIIIVLAILAMLGIKPKGLMHTRQTFVH